MTKAVVDRFVPGETTADAVRATAALQADGSSVALDYLGENTTDPAQADATVDAYLELIEALAGAAQVGGAEVTVKLSAVGQALPTSDRVPKGGHAYALAGARRIADAAYAAGARMTLDMEDHTTVDATLETLLALRADHPDVGVAIQAMLLRTPADLIELIGPGSRVRLVKGAYDEPEGVAFTDPDQIDLSYVRGLKVLMRGRGYPMVGSHDPRMIAIADRLARGRGSAAGPVGIPDAVRDPSRGAEASGASGKRMRVYVPYGTDWYGYFTRRLAERPANLLFFLRSLATRS